MSRESFSFAQLPRSTQLRLVRAPWFSKRRGLAIGIAVSGTGIGGLAFGPLTELMITNLGIEWALRITGIVQFVVVIICALLYRSRFKPLRRKSVVALAGAKKTKVFDFSFFKNRQFAKMWACQFIGFFGFFYPFVYGSTYAASVGLSSQQGATIIGLTNAGSTLGRLIVGTFSDRFGNFNSFVICIWVGALSMMVIWPFCKSFGTLIFFGVFYSFFSGGFISLQPACLAEIIGISAMGSAIGLLYVGFLRCACRAFLTFYFAPLPTCRPCSAVHPIDYFQFAGATSNLVGPPIGGLLIKTTTNPDGTTSQNYLPVQLFGGAMMAIAGCFMFWIRMERANWRILVRV